ncbi:hypothetical protein Pmar_PMAR028113 [Perkinsus marinus ATCC 50983]|uniref:Uncharacterized protein n=1 Tax=Perkinsus marinus (strain ATCC 50983 / TXsc) TaxID=423536 RepID=C5KF27_PERM5|nr:hypothetical protein Pmar_PMAR028113 [Perkinsus marinus ATCC 50983]EER16916.1 hypothetical protein Pmar_PMAR028113 [Perkinsus marinus ATCC 50983]|eukprot:XP_002785120.1 hypothetical protein Pmar_PMAR028113 [Perkinsus marinus ATCC 50983]
MIIYLYIDARRARLPSREEEPIRGAGSDFALAQVGPMIDASRINVELRPVAVVKKDKYGEEQGTVVLKMKLTTLENEPATTEPPVPPETSPSPSTHAVPKTIATTQAASVPTQAQYTAAAPTKPNTTPEPIEFELVPVTKSGKGKNEAEPNGDDDARLETVASGEVEKVSGEVVTAKALPSEAPKGSAVNVSERTHEVDSVGKMTVEDLPSESSVGKATRKGDKSDSTRSRGTDREVEQTTKSITMPLVEVAEPATTSSPRANMVDDRTEDMAAIVERLEKLEAEVGSKTQPRKESREASGDQTKT